VAGRADVAPDGSPVVVYGALPGRADANRIHAAVPAGASLLELGSGPGRVTVELVRLGHRVTAVDQSPAMLAALPRDPAIEPVQADIETLDLGRQFAGVIAASHLLNTDAPLVDAFLDAVRRHVAGDGVLVAEVYPPAMDWPAAVGRRSEIGSVGVTVARASVQGDRLDATVVYDLGDERWEQPFTAVMRDERALDALFHRGGLRFDRWLDPGSGWLVARPIDR
jgi:SAM-dependent methyltransferase